jgi:ElaB/YqjD/DUF883 family membrane-anchored ribosome-binding protein
MTNPTRTEHGGVGSDYSSSQTGYNSSTESRASASESTDFTKLKEEVANLKDVVSKALAGAGGDAWKTVREVGETVASQVGTAASGMANAASAQAKTVASDLESAVRKNPLGAMAGALVAGILIGLMGRGRS